MTDKDKKLEILRKLRSYGCPESFLQNELDWWQARLDDVALHARIDELTDLHRSEGKGLPKRTWDTFTDELINERLTELQLLDKHDNGPIPHSQYEYEL